MRLTENQREILDKAIIDIIETTEEEIISINDLLNLTENLFNERLHRQNIASSFDRIYSLRFYDNKLNFRLIPTNTPSVYRIQRIDIFISDNFTKNKNILSFGDSFSYDFITKKFSIDLNNKQIQNERGCIVGIKYFTRLLNYEWLFNYTNSIDEISLIIKEIDADDLKTMPQGLLEYLDRENALFNARNLKEYYRIVKYGVDGVKFMNYFGSTTFEKMIGAGLTVKDINKLACNSIKNMNYNLDSYVKDFVYTAFELKNKNIDFEIDKNRDLEYNTTLLKNLLNKEKNEKLAKKMQQLNFINGFTCDDYIVVVPQNQEEKQAEGRMQNNCVGYFYDNSILEDRDLIYFIRKINSPNKSYMTCRYNRSTENTVEFRLINNSSVIKEKDRKMVELVTKMINENL